MEKDDDNNQKQVAGDNSEDTTAMMEEILEKLKLLNYEREFLLTKGYMDKPLNRAYFAVPINQTEQFSYFKSLVKWLFQLNQIQVEFAKYDDPMTVLQQILEEIGRVGIPNDYQVIKLKSGSGEEICLILLALTNLALQKKFKFKRAVQDSKGQGEDPIIDKEGDHGIELGEGEDQISEDRISDDLDEGQQGEKKPLDEERMVLKSAVDEKEWYRECERVTPQLQIKVRTDAKEWRAHLTQAKTHADMIQKVLPTARTQMESKADDLLKILERITKSENKINVNMNELGVEYKQQAEELKIYATRYNELNERVRELGEEYQQLSEKLEKIQANTQVIGSNMTDSTPIVKVKSALQSLRQEIKFMDLRIGVLNHTVMTHKFKEKKTQEEKIDFDPPGDNYLE